MANQWIRLCFKPSSTVEFQSFLHSTFTNQFRSSGSFQFSSILFVISIIVNLFISIPLFYFMLDNAYLGSGKGTGLGLAHLGTDIAIIKTGSGDNFARLCKTYLMFLFP